MIRIANKLGLIVLFALVLLSACQSDNSLDKDAAFLSLLGVSNVNQSVSLTSQDFLNDGKIGGYIDLGIENLSNQEVEFPYDYGTRLFVYQEHEGEWIEIENKITYFASTNPTLTPKGSGLYVGSVSVKPDIQNEGQPVTVRVVVVGETLAADGVKDEQVAAYVDVTLQP